MGFFMFVLVRRNLLVYIFATAFAKIHFDDWAVVDHYETILQSRVRNHVRVNAERFILSRLMDAVFAVIGAVLFVARLRRTLLVIDRAETRLAESLRAGNY